MSDGKLGSRAIAEAMEAAARSARPLADALRATMENSGITLMMESVKQHEEAMRTALGSFEKLRRAGVFDVDSLRRRDMEMAQKVIARFRITVSFA